MDHIGFENEMIDAVNRNSKNADKARINAIAAEKKKAYIRRCIKSKATKEIIVWVTVYLCAVISLSFLSWLRITHPMVPTVSCAVVGLVTGFRINALIRAFKN